MSLPIDDVLEVLRTHLPHEQITAIARDLIKVEKEAKAAAAAEKDSPKAKSHMVVLLRGDASLRRLVEGGAWVVSEQESTIPRLPLTQRIAAAVKFANENLRGKNRATKVIRTFARAMEWLRTKSIKSVDGQFTVKTKTPVEVIVIDQESL